MKVAAFDISAKNTGLAIGDGDGPPDLRSYSSSGSCDAETLCNLMKWVSGVLKSERPDAVAIEAAILMANASASASTARLALELAGVVKATVWLRTGKRAHEIPVQSWRRSFLGKNPAAQTDPVTGRKVAAGKIAKQQAIDLCGRLGWNCMGEDDRAEAAGLFYHAHCTIPGGNQRGVKAMLRAARA